MIIYKITNKVNGKVYIGQTINDIKYRWRDHCSKKTGSFIGSAIQKYNKSNFVIEQIEQVSSLRELDEREIYWISFYRSNSVENGYNLTAGGSGYSPRKARKIEIKKAKKEEIQLLREKKKKDLIDKGVKLYREYLADREGRLSLPKKKKTELDYMIKVHGLELTTTLEEARMIDSNVARTNPDWYFSTWSKYKI